MSPLDVLGLAGLALGVGVLMHALGLLDVRAPRARVAPPKVEGRSAPSSVAEGPLRDFYREHGSKTLDDLTEVPTDAVWNLITKLDETRRREQSSERPAEGPDAQERE